jgi:hypothetical protein
MHAMEAAGLQLQPFQLGGIGETNFWQALALARGQGAESWELRAVLSLRRLYH